MSDTTKVEGWVEYHMSGTVQTTCSAQSNNWSVYKSKTKTKKRKIIIAHTGVYSRNGQIYKINKKEKKINYKEKWTDEQ